VSVPPIPAPLDQLGQRRFSFYPPIVNIEHNEWIVRRVTWSEVHVMNAKTSTELFLPRAFVGEASLVEEPVMIVGLVKELEYKNGAVLPHVRRVIEMPRAVNDSFRPRIRPAETAGPAPVVGIRLEPSTESRTSKRMRTAFAAGILACVASAIVLRDGTMGSRAKLAAPIELHLPLTASDGYDSIVNKLGRPARDRWFEIGGMEYRRLSYPQRSYALLLMGAAKDDHAFYIGAIDPYGRVIHSVQLSDGRNSAALIRRLR
jgi:hypothetical protein